MRLVLAIGLSEPAILWCLAPALLVAALFEVRLDGSWSRRLVRAIVRGCVLTALLLALGGAYVSRHVPVTPRLVIAVEHAQDSQPIAGAAWDVVERAAHTAQREGFEVTVIPYGHRVHAPTPFTPTIRSRLPVAETGAPDPARALRAAAGVYARHETGGVLLVSSGHGRHEGLADATAALRAQGRRVAAWAVPTQGVEPVPRPEVVAMEAPKETADPFAVHVAAQAQAPSDVVLWVDGARKEVVPIAATKARPVDVTFSTLTMPPGVHHLSVTIEPRDGTAPSPEVEREVEVIAPPRYVGCVDIGSVFWRALELQRMVVQWEPTAAELALRLPDPSKGGPQPMDVLIADADRLVKLPATAQAALVGWVRRGMGLVVSVGGTQNAWRDLGRTPLAALLPLTPQDEPAPEPTQDPPPTPLPPPINVDPPKKDKGPGRKTQRRPDEARPLTLLILIDKSMSMAVNGKFQMAIEAATRAAKNLGMSDRLGVMTFAHETEVVLVPRRRPASLVGISLGGLEPDGRATNIYLALKEAVQIMRVQNTSIKHVLLITDGEQYPEGPIFGPVVKRLRGEGVTLTAVGIGRGAKMAQLRHIVRFAAGGKAIYAPTPEDVPTIVTKDTGDVVRDRDTQVRVEGLLDNPDDAREPEPPKPDDPPPPPPLPNDPTPEGDRTEDDTPKGPDLAPLLRVRGHEAVVGLPPGPGPAVMPPRRSVPRPHGLVLLVREPDAPVLAAARAGLGRVLTWTLQDDDKGIRGWAPTAALLAQVVRAARTPPIRFLHRPRIDIVQRLDGAVLQVIWPEGTARGGFDVTWVGPDGPQSLGRLAPGTTRERIPLPAAPPGATATLTFTHKGKDILPARTYRVPQVVPVAIPPGDQRALDQHVGPRPADLSRLVSTLPWGRREERQPIWPWLLWGALALLPLDVFLHRRTR